MPLWEHLLATLIYFLSGFFSFFVIFDRIILHMWESWLKTFTVYSSMTLFLVGSAIAGWLMGVNHWIYLPVTILTVLLVGEIYRHYLIHTYEQMKPVIRDNDGRKIAKLFTTQSLIVRQYELPHEKWTGPPVRIAQLTDLHVNGYPPMEFYQDCIQRLNELKPDIVVLTGDYVNKAKYVPDLQEILSGIKSKYGVYGILGNHEFYIGQDRVRAVLEKSGVILIHGKHHTIRTSDGFEVQLFGHENPWGPAADADLIKSQTDLSIILTHTPDTIYHLSDHLADVVFAGHLHGGQWRFPFVGSIVVPSLHGRLFDQGHFRIKNTHLFVSAGLGLVWFPCRLRCYPEILTVDVVPAGNMDGDPIKDRTLCAVSN